MNRGDKAIIVIPLGLVILTVSYKVFQHQQRSNRIFNDMKSALAQSGVVNMNTLSSYGIPDPSARLLYGSNTAYFKFNSCCSEQHFPKLSRTFYKAGIKTAGGHTYEKWADEWCDSLGGRFSGNCFPKHLAKGSFGDAQIKVQGKLYDLLVVNDAKAKTTTIMISPDDNSELPA